jgi:hypothetical protein
MIKRHKSKSYTARRKETRERLLSYLGQVAEKPKKLVLVLVHLLQLLRAVCVRV